MARRKPRPIDYSQRDLLKANAWKPPMDRPIGLSENAIFIPVNTPSSKNSKVRAQNSTAIVSSNIVRRYIAATDEFYKHYKFWIENLVTREKLDYPIKLGFYPVRDTNKAFDYINIMQIVADLAQANEWIKDDSNRYMMPIPLGFHVNKHEPGIWLDILG